MAEEKDETVAGRRRPSRIQMSALLLSVAFAILALALFAADTIENTARPVRIIIDTNTLYAYSAAEFTVPLTIISAAFIAGFIIIIGDRKKARGMWFSGPEKFR